MSHLLYQIGPKDSCQVHSTKKQTQTRRQAKQDKETLHHNQSRPLAK